jgi:hypothetical protein
MRNSILILALLACATASAVDMQDRELTPGAARVVTLAQLCVPGAAAKARNVSAKTKLAVYNRYGMTKARTGYCSGPEGCEVDHLISIELGGSNDITNLWPQPYNGAWNAHMKDALENKLHSLVCSGHLTMSQAQTLITSDWERVYKTYVNPNVD